MIGDSDGKNKFPHELCNSSKNFANLCKAFENYLSTDIKLSKSPNI